MIRVCVVDDHPLVRLSIARLLSKQQDIAVVGEAADGQAALNLVEEIKPDILVLDIEMPVMSGIEVAENMYQKESPTKIIILSNYTDRGLVEEMVALGAQGYVVKDDAPTHLVNAVHDVYDRCEGAWLSPGVQNSLR